MIAVVRIGSALFYGESAPSEISFGACLASASELGHHFLFCKMFYR